MASTAASRSPGGFFRWGAIVPAIGVLAATVVFSVFFLDSVVERGIERAGTKANGAKVELDDVDISIFGLSITLRGLKVTDRSDPMRNAIEVESLKFDVAGKPLAWKKIVIEKGEITGIRTGTPRKRSGAIKVTREEAEAGDGAGKTLSGGARDAGKKAASFAMGNLKEQYDPKKMVQLENLSSYKKVESERARIGALGEKWEKQVDDLKVEGKVAEIKAWVKKVSKRKYSSGFKGIAEAKKTLDEAKKYRKDIKAMKRAVTSVKSSLTSEVVAARKSIKQIDALKAKDYAAAVGPLKGGAFSAEGLSRGVIGAGWFGRIESALGWFHRIRGMVPKSKEKGKKKAEPVRLPRRGQDIIFPFKHRWPVFHLKKASLDGVTGGAKPLEYAGTLKDVTSDPKLLGRPILLNVSGGSGSRSLILKAKFDYTRKVSRETVDFRYSGIELGGVKLGKVGAPVSIASGKGSATANLATKGNGISGKIKFLGKPIKIKHALSQAQARQRLMVILSGVLNDMKTMDVTVYVSDTITSPNFKIRTNIDKQLKAAVKQVLSRELKQIQKKIRARINGLVDGKKNELTGMVAKRVSAATGKLTKKSGALGSVEKEISKLTKGLGKKTIGGFKL